LVAGLALEPGRTVRYREEVQHPALAEPELATGSMFVAGDGDLVREQVTPERQISEVGETMLSTRSAPDAEPTLYPIPDEARPVLLALRRMLAGDAKALAADFETDLAVEEEGWHLALRPRAANDGAAISFGGCGAELRTVEIVQPDGVRRSLTVSPGR
jgi:hypothetical protein